MIGTLILSPAGEKLGYVKEAYVTRDMTALSCLIAVDEEEEEFILPARAVLAAKDAVIAGRNRVPSPTGVPAPMGRAVFSDRGEYLGAVCDVTLSASPAITVLREGVPAVFPLTHVAVGETLIVFPEARKKRKPARRPSEAAKQATARTLEPTPSASAVPDVPAPSAPLQNVPREVNAFAFNRYDLLGRRVKRSVFDAYGVPVAIAGERITPEMLSVARKRNRLLALTVSTLTNAY